MSGHYIITPELERYIFDPSNREIPNLASDTSGMDFTSKLALCAARRIYGEDSDEVKILRYLRDNLLNQSLEGRALSKPFQ
jgi:hypothetical protein